MSTMERTSGLAFMPVALVIGAVVWAVFAATLDLGDTTITLRDHAVEKHGMDAWVAREAAANGGPDDDWECKDGTTHRVIWLEAMQKYAVLIYGHGKEASSWLESSEAKVYKDLFRDGCVRKKRPPAYHDFWDQLWGR